MVVNMLVIIAWEVVTKLLGLEVDEEVVVPRIIWSDIKEMFVREVGIDEGTGSIGGEGHDKFGKEERFLALGCWKFNIVLLKDNDPSGKFSINFSTTEKVLHGIGIFYDFSHAKKNVMAQFLDCEDDCEG
jgi:hypothetical protein